MKKVLLVSASKVFLTRNTNLLVGRGFLVFTASNGATALSLHHEHQFDLVLSELELEDMDGGALCSTIRLAEDSRHLPVILICYDIGNSIRKVEQSGASAMLLKPVDPTQLLETVGSFLDMQLARSKRVALTVNVVSMLQHLEFICISRDISTTGILLETEHQLSLGCRIVCKFKLTDTCQVETAGEVIRCMSGSDDKNFYGVKFLALQPHYRQAIDDYVARNMQISRTNSPEQKISPSQPPIV